MPMLSDFEPVIFNAPHDADEIVLHAIHDLHYGNQCFDPQRWSAIMDELQKPGHYCVFVGDLMENAVVGGKSDVLYQTCPPSDQRDWVVDQFRKIGTHKIIGVTDGNHERRSLKEVGAWPIRDACLLAGGDLEERYRSHFLFVDLGVGTRLRSGSNSKTQNRYNIFCVHRAKMLKNFCSSDYVDGCDVFIFGHDHDPQSHPRASIRYDHTRKVLSIGVTRVVNCGANLNYGGYAVDGGYRPQPLVDYKIHLSGTKKETWIEER